MKDNIKAIIFIFILGILIILPPLFRVLFPKDNTFVEDQTLICTLDKEHYQITYQTVYKNSQVDYIQVQYSDLNFPKGDLHLSSFANQINYFCGLKESTYHYVNSDIVITLNQKVYQSNSHDETIRNMYKPYSLLKKYYEKLGYRCK